MFGRDHNLNQLLELLDRFPVVGIVGARQVGKTTLARAMADEYGGPSIHLDMENPEDLARLSDPMLALQDLRGLVVIDEVQRKPELFPVLRVLADRPDHEKAHFLVLGSASPELLRQGSESLAGRVVYYAEDFRSPSSPTATKRVSNGARHSFEPSSSVTCRNWVSTLPRKRCAASGPCWPTSTDKPGTRLSWHAPSG